MKYYSTNRRASTADFKEATIKGQAGDGGLFFPEEIPTIDADIINNLKQLSREEIALQVIIPYVGDTIPETKLRDIVEETINFEIPLVKLDDNLFALELFHGPTQAFKDIGARFMSRSLGYFVQDIPRKVTVLVATSGDTGGAVADGFAGVDGINVVILYPSGKVSKVQELQLTTHGKNITALEVAGSFDDCQDMVKQAFADKDLADKFFLTSANSINVARWLPQQFYYFFALRQWMESEPPVISVPSGNFGNICAGILAWKSGLPVKKFIAASNANRVIPDFFDNGEYKTAQTISTISNAMDVGNPSNFIRILEIFDHQSGDLKDQVKAYSVSDDDTRHAMRILHSKYNYLSDPHSAVAFAALHSFSAENNNKGIFLETAHPVKFYDTVKKVTGEDIPIPALVQQLLLLEKKSVQIPAAYSSLKDFLMQSV